jgi:hypothetical protein
MAFASLALVMNASPSRESAFLAVTELCRLALEGKLPLDQLHQRWPQEANASSLLTAVFDDLEDAVEHYPAEWVFPPLQLDLLLLGRAEEDRILHRCRQELLQDLLLKGEDPAPLVRRFFEREPQ